VQLLAFDRLPRQEVKFSRGNIYLRDGNRCQYCGKKMPTTELSLDHDERHAFVGHLDRVRVPQLVRSEPATNTGEGGGPSELLASG